jgi:nucleotide-binding universal stress UspA family protein
MVELGDGPQAVAAMDTALWLAKTFGAQLRALTCLDERSVQSDRIRRMLEEHTSARQAKFEERCRKAGVKCINDMEVGDPHEALVHLSRKTDLLVLGSAPDPDAQTRGYSSAALSIARDCVRHVLVVRGKAPRFKSIVVGYAGRENSCNALQLSAHIAERAGGTIHVVTSNQDLVETGAILNVAMDYLKTYDVKAIAHEASEDPTKVLLDAVKETGADMIAIGALRRSKLSLMAFGDTAQHILDSSPVAVLIGR